MGRQTKVFRTHAWETGESVTSEVVPLDGVDPRQLKVWGARATVRAVSFRELTANLYS